MDNKDNFSKHYEDSAFIPVNPTEVFAFADNHTNFSSHMNKSSWMMGGGKMETQVDEEKGQKIGSHIKMSGNILGIKLSLDEVVTIYKPPFHKEWQTVGKTNLLVIDHYKLGFEIKPEKAGAILKVYIDYGLPKSATTYLLGYFFGEAYARWCVKQMLKGSVNHFNNKSS